MAINQPSRVSPVITAATQAIKKPQGTGFTNLRSVLEANRNAGQRLAQNIGSNIQQQGQQVQQRLGQAQRSFAQNTQEAKNTAGQGENFQQQLGGADYTKEPSAASQRLSELGNQQNVNLVGQINQGYQGPQGLQDSAQLKSQADRANQQGLMIGDKQGREELLKRYAGGDQYTSGQRRLDSLLLGQNVGDLSQARRSVQGLGTDVNRALSSAETEAGSLSSRYNTLQDQIKNKLYDQAAGLRSYLDTVAKTKGSESAQFSKDLQDRLKAGEITQEDADLLKNVLGGENIYNLTGQDLASMISANPNITRSSVASQQDLAARDALMRLTGLNEAQLGVDLDEENIGKGGEQVLGEKERFGKETKARESERQKTYDDFKSRVLDPTSGLGELKASLESKLKQPQTYRDQASLERDRNMLSALESFDPQQLKALTQDPYLSPEVKTWLSNVSGELDRINEQYGKFRTLSGLIKKDRDSGAPSSTTPKVDRS